MKLKIRVMIQIKKYKSTTTIPTINKFLANHDVKDYKVLDDGSFLIEYHVEEFYEKPLAELRGLPVKFEFGLYYRHDSYQNEERKCVIIRCGHILFFNDFIIFNTPEAKYKLDLDKFVLSRYDKFAKIYRSYKIPDYPDESNMVFAHVASFYVRHNYNSYHPDKESLPVLMDILMNEEIIPTDRNSLYHIRTNAIVEAAHINNEGRVKQGKQVKEGLYAIAVSNLISAKRTANAMRTSTNAVISGKVIRYNPY